MKKKICCSFVTKENHDKSHCILYHIAYCIILSKNSAGKKNSTSKSLIEHLNFHAVNNCTNMD